MCLAEPVITSYAVIKFACFGSDNMLQRRLFAMNPRVDATRQQIRVAPQYMFRFACDGHPIIGLYKISCSYLL
jgi:hypothetical protein